MGTFNTEKILYGPSSLVPEMARRIRDGFSADGFDVKSESLSSGGFDISITKGGIFKAVMGMKTALKVTLTPHGNTIEFEAGVGIWGQQAIPTVISMLFFWPVLITQIWGMINQSRLDDRALEIAESVLLENASKPGPETAAAGDACPSIYCTGCGTRNPSTAKFCNACGKPLTE